MAHKFWCCILRKTYWGIFRFDQKYIVEFEQCDQNNRLNETVLRLKYKHCLKIIRPVAKQIKFFLFHNLKRGKKKQWIEYTWSLAG